MEVFVEQPRLHGDPRVTGSVNDIGTKMITFWWWLFQVADTCAKLGETRKASKGMFLYDPEHRLLFCRNAKVGWPGLEYTRVEGKLIIVLTTGLYYFSRGCSKNSFVIISVGHDFLKKYLHQTFIPKP